MVIRRIRDVEMIENSNTTTHPTEESSSSLTTIVPTTSHNVTTTASTPPDETNRIIIISVTCVVIVLLLIFIISMAVFIKWKSKRKTEGAYNPSRAEKQEHLKNKPVFSIPLPTPERLI